MNTNHQNLPASNSLAARAGTASRAFTLVEMLVAVGAVALVSVGLAAVFQTVGRTVTTGKRVSALTQQAAILESQMREDFKHMSREGFLVIRNQFTLGGLINNAQPISASRYAGDPLTARPRRVDELLFFANGDYQTAREDLIPGRTAKGRAARIYYGHGQKAFVQTPQQQQAFGTDMKYLNPTFMDFFLQTNPNTNTRLGDPAPLNPNRYASSWNLIRQAMVLARPTTVSDGGWPADRPRPYWYSAPSEVANNASALNTLTSDSTFQIAGQPAVSSIFRTINEMFPLADNLTHAKQSSAFTMFWPIAQGGVTTVRNSSGVVDIAATDLDEIALIVNGSVYSPGEKGGVDSFVGRYGPYAMVEAPLPLTNGPWLIDPATDKSFVDPDFTTKLLVQDEKMPNTGKFAIPFYASSFVVAPKFDTKDSLNTTAARMQAWMLNAMPVPSGYAPTVWNQDSTRFGVGVVDGTANRLGFRVRCEDDLPDIRGTMDTPDNRSVQTMRNNLLAVGLAKIAPHCSEFVVEWSFGQTFPMNAVAKDEFGNDVRGQTIWYGRTLGGYETDTKTQYQISNSPGAANPQVYRYDPGANYSAINGKFNDLGRRIVAPTPSPEYKPFKGSPEFAGISIIDDYVVPHWLTHGVVKWSLNGFDQSSLVSYFGYFDPTYKPTDLTTQPPSMPWAWPKMIRVTFTLADASDPSIEQTFQYVFDLPPDPKP
ncbi:MAG: PulJ/GspJ family protein [Phycisphaerales bacterium]